LTKRIEAVVQIGDFGVDLGLQSLEFVLDHLEILHGGVNVVEAAIPSEIPFECSSNLVRIKADCSSTFMVTCGHVLCLLCARI